jgi:hypothetical protein
MAKARQVGTPHSPQFFLGNFLNISIPLNAISKSPFYLAAFSIQLSAVSFRATTTEAAVFYSAER